MMRSLLTAGLLVASLQNVLAQDAQTTTAPSTSNSEEDMNEYWASRSSYSASLSSRIGSFYRSMVFAPAVTPGDYLSVLGSGGPNDPNAETTTYRAYMSVDVEDKDKWIKAQATTTLYAYQNFTVGPTTYMASDTFGDWSAEFGGITTTFAASDATTICSLTRTSPKISIPDSVWATQDFSTLVQDNWPTYSAVCTMDAHYTRNSSVSDVSTVMTPDAEAWRYVTVLGQDPHTMTKTGTAGGAQQTGDAAQVGSGSATEGAKATSTQAAGASEVTAWVNAVVVVAAAAAML